MGDRPGLDWRERLGSLPSRSSRCGRGGGGVITAAVASSQGTSPGEGCFHTAGGGGAFAEAVMSEGPAK